MSALQKNISTNAFTWIFEHGDKKGMLRQLSGNSSKDLKRLRGVLTAGGFKLSEATLERQRTRLCGALQHAAALVPAFVDIVAESAGPWHAIHRLMADNESATRHLWRAVLDHAAMPGIAVLALAVFPKDSWQRRLAFRLVKIDSIWSGGDGSSRQKTSAESREALCKLFGLGAQTPDTAADAADLEENLAREYRRGRAEERVEQEQKAARERRIWDGRLKEAQLAADNACQERNAMKAELRAVRTDAGARLAQQKAAMEEQFQSSLDALFAQCFLAYKPLVHTAVASQNDTDALIAKLSSATEQQLAYSKSHGSRTALLRQKQALTAALEKLQHAVDDAIVTLDGLPALMAEARSQIQLIDSKLAQEPTISLVASQLAAYVDSIKLDENATGLFDGARHFIQMARELEVLDKNEVHDLEKRIAHRLGILNNGAFSHAIEQNLSAHLTVAQPKVTREIWNIMQYVGELPRVTLVLDGYNAMMRNDVWWQMTRERSFDEARRDFIERCRLKHDRFQSIIAVFDGTGSIITHEKPADNMTVTFAPHVNDAHNADDVMVSCCQNLRAAGKADVIWAVTNDYDLRKRLENTCDAFVETRAIPQFFLL